MTDFYELIQFYYFKKGAKNSLFHLSYAGKMKQTIFLETLRAY